MIKKVLFWILGIAVTLLVIGGGIALFRYTAQHQRFTQWIAH